jgi:hypothetical protein
MKIDKISIGRKKENPISLALHCGWIEPRQNEEGDREPYCMAATSSLVPSPKTPKSPCFLIEEDVNIAVTLTGITVKDPTLNLLKEDK